MEKSHKQMYDYALGRQMNLKFIGSRTENFDVKIYFFLFVQVLSILSTGTRYR
jgi:hypothetical protein